MEVVCKQRTLAERMGKRLRSPRLQSRSRIEVLHGSRAVAIMNTPRNWKYLEPHPCSNYRQLFIKGRRIKASDLYAWYDPEGDPKMTAEDLAKDFDLPLEAVLEAIAYCES